MMDNTVDFFFADRLQMYQLRVCSLWAIYQLICHMFYFQIIIQHITYSLVTQVRAVMSTTFFRFPDRRFPDVWTYGRMHLRMNGNSRYKSISSINLERFYQVRTWMQHYEYNPFLYDFLGEHLCHTHYTWKSYFSCLLIPTKTTQYLFLCTDI